MNGLLDGKLEDNAGFVLYNFLYSRKGKSFTINQIEEELKNSGMPLPRSIIEKEINGFVRDGLLSRGMNQFTRIAMG